MRSGSANHTDKTSNGRRSYWAAAVVLVGALHVGGFLALGLVEVPASREPGFTPIAVELVRRHDPVPPPPPDPQPSAPAGGGAPAQSSRIHVPPTPVVPRPELPLAPPTPAPEPELTIGAAPRSDPQLGLGQGGTGEGRGNGQGSGDGSGQGSRPVFLRGATNGEILSQMPRELQRRRGPARSAVRCTIRPDTRLEGCTLVAEQPAGLGYGAAAIRVVEANFRFRPPTDVSGGVIEGQDITVNIDFPSR